MSARFSVRVAAALSLVAASAAGQSSDLPALPAGAPVPLAPPPAPGVYAPAPPEPAPVVSPAPPGPPRAALRFGAEVGWRTQRITSRGYDPFSRDDWHGFSSISGWYVALTRGPWSLAATGGWDLGMSTSTAREQPTSLMMHRLWAAPEARLQVARLGHLLLRAGPSVWHLRAELDDEGLVAPLVRRPWKVGADVAAGARARVVEFRDPRGAWLVGFVGAEAGYAYVPKVDLGLAPKARDVEPRDVRGLRLPSLDASGLTVRLTVSGAF
ncbi:MAG: hypothetical protein IT374_15585 [Polyangiaceae bacterium]|nr:hypothetical protein [Polyangiaceae bacterium]